MTVLRNIEQKIEALFEGVFGRAFRTNVQPVELARKLAKEMDDHRMVSVSRVYVPNEYSLYLSQQDRAQFEGYEGSLRAELQDYLSEHAKREGYALLSKPEVKMETDDDLQRGEFGIATRMVQKEAAPAAAGLPASQPQPGATMIYRAAQPQPTEAAPGEAPGPSPGPATLTVDGARHELGKRTVVIGRSRDCDIRLSDPNASRRHAELRQEGSTYWLVDLGSTNGTAVNGRREERARLEHQDRITIGSTDLVFERTPG